MSEVEQSFGNGKVRKCLWCRKMFEAAKPKQNYCCAKCRGLAWKARKRESEGIQGNQGGQLKPEAMLQELQQQRDRLNMPRLEVLEYLEVRAGILEAEEQLRQWHKRLQDRRTRLLGLQEPPLSRHVELLVTDGPLHMPHRAMAIGIVSTDGLIGVAIYGTPH